MAMQSENTNDAKEEEKNNIIKRVNVLLLSDIHCNKANIMKVKDYISASNIKVHHLWMPGDFLNVSAAENEDEKTIKDSEIELIDLLSAARSIHDKPVILPGNHDPITLFKTDNDKYFNFAKCVNIHKQMYAVDGETNLFMIGFGGSVPAICESTPIWSGYPFKNDTEFGKEFIPFIENNMKSSESGKNVVLFTHNGPSKSSTTMDWRKHNVAKIIESGSDSVRDVILDKDLRDRIICNIHGHTHAGVGQARIGHVPIINPGSLCGKIDGGHNCNTFALMELVQFKDETWMCDNVRFKSLTQ